LRDNQRQRVYDAEGAAFLGIKRASQTKDNNHRVVAWGNATPEYYSNLDPLPEDISNERVQKLIDKVFGSKYVKRKWEQKQHIFPLVKTARSDATRGCADYAAGTIVLPMLKYHRRQSYIIHECAHFITNHYYGSDIAAHGWQFCDIYLDLVRHFMGKEAYEALKSEFQFEGVRYRTTYSNSHS
jgi:putative metallohydrolase (TIGR04338 family)